MEQKLIVMIDHSVRDMSVQCGSKSRKEFALEELTPGAILSLGLGRDLQVVSLTDDELCFLMSSNTYVVNRYWQVFGTMSMSVPDATSYVSESVRYTFYFSAEAPMAEEELDGQLDSLYKSMMENETAGDEWKNIPLARQMLHLMKETPLEQMADIKAALCEEMWYGTLVDERETPRLSQSFVEYGALAMQHRAADGLKTRLENEGRSFIWDNRIYKLSIMATPSLTAWEKWNVGHFDYHLLFDPRQMNPEWEKCIYEVEKEVAELTKDAPRGMGFCFQYWAVKRAVLAKYGIEWSSPQTMNPRVLFD